MNPERLQEVCIGIPMATTIPPSAPPLPTSASAPPASYGGGRSPPLPRTSAASESSIDQQQDKCSWVCIPVCLLLVLFWSGLLCLIFSGNTNPSFKVEHVSVFVENSSTYNNSTTAHWNIGFDVDASSEGFRYTDLDVLLRCMSHDWSTTVVRSSNRDARNVDSLYATVNTLLPRGLSFQLGSTLEFDVLFRVGLRDSTIFQAICKNVTVGFSSSANQGFTEPGPKLCLPDSHNYS